MISRSFVAIGRGRTTTTALDDARLTARTLDPGGEWVEVDASFEAIFLEEERELAVLCRLALLPAPPKPARPAAKPRRAVTPSKQK